MPLKSGGELLLRSSSAAAAISRPGQVNCRAAVLPPSLRWPCSFLVAFAGPSRGISSAGPEFGEEEFGKSAVEGRHCRGITITIYYG